MFGASGRISGFGIKNGLKLEIYLHFQLEILLRNKFDFDNLPDSPQSHGKGGMK